MPPLDCCFDVCCLLLRREQKALEGAVHGLTLQKAQPARARKLGATPGPKWRHAKAEAPDIRRSPILQGMQQACVFFSLCSRDV